jgi:hypothetical protein
LVLLIIGHVTVFFVIVLIVFILDLFNIKCIGHNEGPHDMSQAQKGLGTGFTVPGG